MLRRSKVLVWLLVVIIGCSTKETSEKETVVDDEDPVLASYFAIVDALNANDFKAVQSAGLKLYDVQATAGPKLALVNMGRLIAEAPTFTEQRRVLYQMGIVLPLYIGEVSLHDYTIYKFRCNNVLEGKEGVWYSKSQETFNPFKGGKSSECIELVETITPVKQIEE